MDKPQLDVRYAPPQVNVDDVDTALEGSQLASRTQRLLAVTLDGVLQFSSHRVLVIQIREHHV